MNASIFFKGRRRPIHLDFFDAAAPKKNFLLEQVFLGLSSSVSPPDYFSASLDYQIRYRMDLPAIAKSVATVFPGSARGSRARFGALAEMPLAALRNEFGKLKTSRSRGRQHASRVGSPDQIDENTAQSLPLTLRT
jgi:hypothetical protein